MVASISDVAKLAGVSKSTVSLVCNNKGYVSPETREKIERAMAELNYTPSALGQNLKLRRSGIIGIIVPDISHPFFSTFLKYAEKSLYRRGYKTMVCGTAGRQDVEEAYLKMLERRTMDGIIMGAHSQKVERYLRTNRPIVALDRFLSEDIPVVRSNKAQIAELAAGLLLKRGRKHIAQLVSSYTVPNFELEKDETFVRLMAQGGAEVTDVSVGYNAFTEEQYALAAQRLFRRCPNVDGIVGTDMAVLACMAEAHRRGLRVPEQISMVAIDGTYVTRIGEMTLTAIVQPMEAMAEQAVDLVLQLLEEGAERPASPALEVTVQEGESC